MYYYTGLLIEAVKEWGDGIPSFLYAGDCPLDISALSLVQSAQSVQSLRRRPKSCMFSELGPEDMKLAEK
jgi:hypothetical protein